jgi:hypothetical protein
MRFDIPKGHLMRYQKPDVFNLNAIASHGKSPWACLSGDSVASVCDSGGDPYTCSTGTGGTNYPSLDCISGPAPSASYGCYSGGTASWECANGVTPDKPGTCTVGPSNV